MRNKILIVDDVPMNRKILADILEAEHYDILEAGNGLEAIQCIESSRDDLAAILLDLVMPGRLRRPAVAAGNKERGQGSRAGHHRRFLCRK